jgi:hypothetical protein
MKLSGQQTQDIFLRWDDLQEPNRWYRWRLSRVYADVVNARNRNPVSRKYVTLLAEPSLVMRNETKSRYKSLNFNTEVKNSDIQYVNSRDKSDFYIEL